MPALYLIRHGTPTVTGVLLGHTDPPLSPTARLDMQTLQINVETIFTSPLLRCAESARLLSGGRVPVREIRDLREISFGDWDGLTWHEIEARWPDLAQAKLADWFGVTPPGGESRTDFIARVDAALDSIVRIQTPCAIVGHQAVNARLAHKLSGSDELTFRQEYGEVYEYTIGRRR